MDIKKRSSFHLTLKIIFFLLFIAHCKTFPNIIDEKQVHTYIVHVQPHKENEFLGDEEREAWHKSFLPNTTLDSGEQRLVYSYREVISGFAARLTSKEVEDMKSMEGFMHAQQDQELSPRTTYTPSFIGLSQWHGLWVDSFMGQGMIIGVIDSGITPGHSSFKDSTVDKPMPPPPKKWKGKCQFRKQGYCNNKLIGAISFQKGRSPAPRDQKTNGHGTHCAGIAAGSMVPDADVRGLAKGTASGVAPRAHLAIYQTCTKTSCSSTDTLKAMDQAIDDGVDVLSISLGPALGQRQSPYYLDNMAIGAFSAIRKGLVASFPAGNSGPDFSSIENDEPWALTVGASSHDRRAKATVKLGDGTEIIGETGYQDNNFNATLPLVFPSVLGQNGTAGCKKDSFDNVDVKGKIVICYIYGGTFIDMGVNVKNAGGAAMIITDTFREGSTTFSDVHVLPVAHVDDPGLKKIIRYLRSNPNPNATITFGGTTFGARPSPTIPYFSSRGPSLLNGGILKPDIVGPGVNVLSAWPKKPGLGPKPPPGSYFNFLSGTSMATPHLAGVAALLKSTHKNWSPAAIKSAIMTTADRLDRDLKPITDDYNGTRDTANLIDLGAGQVNPQAADDPGLVYDIKPFNYIQYLCGIGYSDANVSTIAGRQIQCANLVKINAEDLNYPSISVTLDPKVKKSIIRQLTNVVDGGTEVYHAVVEDPKGISVDVSPNTLRFSRLDQKRKFTIEFKVIGMPLSQGETAQGQLLWISPKHEVRSPILVTFA
ncbi:Peptidase S8 subtilisin-related protein [Dioscorea alata]|uniref:Peptidase S8 subtilisin-related protein n=1 Tax=Dioscorea alata TaxID=55571 RepID=A0ACB7VEH9_DIOAL|nr:Peptidase S8 subtilisin-related protein [Dioscorea alata]